MKYVIASLTYGLTAIFMAVPLWLLWNALVPSIFDLRPIDFLEALGIYVLANIFFKK